MEESLLRWAKHRKESLEQVVSASHYRLAPFLRGMDESVRQWLATDLAVLIAHFAHQSRSKRVRIAFGPIKADRCRKFHTDNLTYRLICTYAGLGTEWVPNEAVDRAAMDGLPGCPVEQNSKIVKDVGRNQHAKVGEVLLMKEDLHPDGPGLVHRSPPIEHLGESRVVLIVSTLDGGW